MGERRPGQAALDAVRAQARAREARALRLRERADSAVVARRCPVLRDRRHLPRQTVDRGLPDRDRGQVRTEVDDGGRFPSRTLEHVL